MINTNKSQIPSKIVMKNKTKKKTQKRLDVQKKGYLKGKDLHKKQTRINVRL